MPGLVPGIHVLAAQQQARRGWPGRAGHDKKDHLRTFMDCFASLAKQ
jgi:hypothetical protein